MPTRMVIESSGMKLGFLKLKATAGIGNNGIGLSALLIGHALFPRNTVFLLLFFYFCYRLSKPQDLVRPEGLCEMKNIQSSHGILNL
jgi:hypothetical protein